MNILLKFSTYAYKNRDKNEVIKLEIYSEVVKGKQNINLIPTLKVCRI